MDLSLFVPSPVEEEVLIYVPPAPPPTLPLPEIELSSDSSSQELSFRRPAAEDVDPTVSLMPTPDQSFSSSQTSALIVPSPDSPEFLADAHALDDFDRFISSFTPEENIFPWADDDNFRNARYCKNKETKDVYEQGQGKLNLQYRRQNELCAEIETDSRRHTKKRKTNIRSSELANLNSEPYMAMSCRNAMDKDPLIRDFISVRNFEDKDLKDICRRLGELKLQYHRGKELLSEIENDNYKHMNKGTIYMKNTELLNINYVPNSQMSRHNPIEKDTLIAKDFRSERNLKDKDVEDIHLQGKGELNLQSLRGKEILTGIENENHKHTHKKKGNTRKTRQHNIFNDPNSDLSRPNPMNKDPLIPAEFKKPENTIRRKDIGIDSKDTKNSQLLTDRKDDVDWTIPGRVLDSILEKPWCYFSGVINYEYYDKQINEDTWIFGDLRSARHCKDTEIEDIHGQGEGEPNLQHHRRKELPADSENNNQKHTNKTKMNMTKTELPNIFNDPNSHAPCSNPWDEHPLIPEGKRSARYYKEEETEDVRKQGEAEVILQYCQGKELFAEVKNDIHKHMIKRKMNMRKAKLQNIFNYPKRHMSCYSPRDTDPSIPKEFRSTRNLAYKKLKKVIHLKDMGLDTKGPQNSELLIDKSDDLDWTFASDVLDSILEKPQCYFRSPIGYEYFDIEIEEDPCLFYDFRSVVLSEDRKIRDACQQGERELQYFEGKEIMAELENDNHMQMSLRKANMRKRELSNILNDSNSHISFYNPLDKYPLMLQDIGSASNSKDNAMKNISQQGQGKLNLRNRRGKEFLAEMESDNHQHTKKRKTHMRKTGLHNIFNEPNSHRSLRNPTEKDPLILEDTGSAGNSGHKKLARVIHQKDWGRGFKDTWNSELQTEITEEEDWKFPSTVLEKTMKRLRCYFSDIIGYESSDSPMEGDSQIFDDFRSARNSKDKQIKHVYQHGEGEQNLEYLPRKKLMAEIGKHNHTDMNMRKTELPNIFNDLNNQMSGCSYPTDKDPWIPPESQKYSNANRQWQK